MTLISALGLASLAFVVLFTMHTYRDDASAGGEQSRRKSIIEAWINILIGFGVNYFMNLLLLPLGGAHFTAMENFWLGCTYTSISMVRQYTIRRWFVGSIHSFAARAARAIS